MKIVISLGGSVIVQDRVNLNYLKHFKNFIHKIQKKNKIVIVTGGGKTARRYIEPLSEIHLSQKNLSLIGISTTKLNALLLASIFGINKIPNTLNELKNQLKQQNLIITGALGFHPNMTSDGTAAEISKTIKADLFINITNVNGLYDKDPKKYKNAKFISTISFNDFWNIAKNIKFHAGQHFVLDKKASQYIMEAKIKTLIANENLKNIQNFLKNKKYIGTLIT